MAEADLRAKCESNGTTKTLKALAGDTVRYIDTISALQKIVVCYGDRDRMASAPSGLQQIIDEALSETALRGSGNG